MNQEKQIYVAVLPDGREYFAEAPSTRRITYSEVQEICEQAATAYKLTASRNYSQTARVQLHVLVARLGVMTRVYHASCVVTLPAAAMTDEELDEELTLLLRDFPSEFKEFICAYACNSFAPSNEEKLHVARSLVTGLMRPLKAYTERITESK